MGFEFHNTGYGRKFFEADLPRLIDALEKIAVELEKYIIRRDKKMPEVTELEKEMATEFWGIIRRYAEKKHNAEGYWYKITQSDLLALCFELATGRKQIC